MSVLLDPNDPGYIDTISGLAPYPGTCVFIDICGSTKIKEKGSKAWIILLGNTFGIIKSSFWFFDWNLTKYIGDEIMLFIPDESATRNRMTFHQTFDDLKVAVRDRFGNTIDDLTLRCKAAIHYCTDVYRFSFHEGTDDYYGKDIDLTARLMTKAIESKVVVSEQYRDKLQEEDSPYLAQIDGPFIEHFKGFPGYQRFYVFG